MDDFQARFFNRLPTSTGEQKSEATLITRKNQNVRPTLPCLAKNPGRSEVLGRLRRCGATATMARFAWVRMVTLGLMVIGGGKGGKGQDAVEHVIFKAFFIFCATFSKGAKDREKNHLPAKQAVDSMGSLPSCSFSSRCFFFSDFVRDLYIAAETPCQE